MPDNGNDSRKKFFRFVNEGKNIYDVIIKN